MTERKLSGCHDWDLVYASIARDLGYPTVMADSAGIAWAKRFLAAQKGPYLGHVFVEVFVAGKWVLVDSTNNWYVEENYSLANPIIPVKMGDETEGMFVMRKGVDTWGYGIRSNQELLRMMEDSARQFNFATLQFPPYNLQRFK
ncbi:MAG: transglutaminase domain-containing protein [Chloroflexota bacterium]